MVEEYSIEKLRDLCFMGKIDDAKDYIKKFFFRCNKPIGVFMYDPIKQDYTLYKNKQMSNFIPKSIGYEKIEGKKIKFVTMLYWFMEEDYDRYDLADIYRRPDEM